MEESRNAYRVLVIKPEGERPLVRLTHRWEHNIRKDLRVVGFDVGDWVDLVQDGANGGLM